MQSVYFNNYIYIYILYVHIASLLILRWDRCIRTKQVAEDTLRQNLKGTFEGWHIFINFRVCVNLYFILCNCCIEVLSIASKWLSDEQAGSHVSASTFTITSMLY